jgi:hypothetical protein
MNSKASEPEAVGPPVLSEGLGATSYLTAREVAAANEKLHKHAPYALCNVSQGFFSIARHYGGLTFQGCHYTYMQGHDECVRDDVLKLVAKMRKAKREAWIAEQPPLLPHEY